MAGSVEYLVGEWEYNGYDDSDFFALYWSPESGFRKEMVGSTRYPSPHWADSKLHPPVPAELIPEVRKSMAEMAFPFMKSAAERRVMAPVSVERGVKVMALSGGKFKDKRSGAVVEWAAGDVGEVFWFGHFGKFYRNGYNKPGRHNARVGVAFPNGKVFLPMEKLRLAEEVPSDEELMANAEYFAARPDLAAVYRSLSYV